MRQELKPLVDAGESENESALLVQGAWGRHSSPTGGFGGQRPPIQVFPNNENFALKPVPFILSKIRLPVVFILKSCN